MNTKFVPLISRPCSQDWDRMTGDDKRRYCEHCQLQVHNLSAMTPGEQKALLSQKQARQCIAYVAPDQSIVVRRSTWLFLQRLFRSWRLGLALLTVWLPASLSSCASKPPPPSPPPSPPDIHACKQATTLPDGKMMVGGLMYEPPLWKRILCFWNW